MSSLVTYENVSPDNIRNGDTITLSDGRTFIAHSDVNADALRQFGEYNVMDAFGRWIAIAADDTVTVSYDESLYETDTYSYV